MKRLTYIIILLFAFGVSEGQQLPLYNQYLYNKFLINPAVAGSDGFTSFNLTAREQWVGYYGAPRTFSFSAQTRLLKKSYILKHPSARKATYRPATDGRVGIGGYIFSDKNGLVQRTGFQAAYSYHIWLRNQTQVSLGLAFTGYHYKIDEEEIDFEDPNEPWLYDNLRRGVFVPDASFGAYLLNAKYNVGFSAEQLFEASAKIGEASYKNYRLQRHYYLFGSYFFELNSQTEIEPSVLFRMTEEIRPQADIGVTYIYKKAFWAGLTYRTSGSLIANLGIKYQNVFIGYAFDFTLSEIQQVTYGTHEITMALKFGDSARKYRWLDRY
ncbi:MAG TPA: type IX secretion system membrane protein PorP/SprF [Bacteroidales bacterium]|nr:type IX secretion system membrane protein PorP/SprF [Bacteroidales bacterium]